MHSYSEATRTKSVYDPHDPLRCGACCQFLFDAVDVSFLMIALNCAVLIA